MNSIITFGENSSLIHNESLNINSFNGGKTSCNSNYLNLSNEELIKETNEKKQKILEYNNTNKVLKKELTSILEKLNLLSQKNKEQLLINNDKNSDLHSLINSKKKEYLIIKQHNTQLKKEYAMLLNIEKKNEENQISDIISNYKKNIQNLKNENFEIRKEINKNETQQMEQQNKVKKIRYDDMKLKNITSYNEKLNKYLEIKNNFINLINNSNKLIKDNIQELNKVENLNKGKNKLITKNEKLAKKINYEMDIIKRDLSGTVEEIAEKCLNDNILIYSLLNKNEITNRKINQNQDEKSINDINKNTNKINISSNVILVNNSYNNNNMNMAKSGHNKKNNNVKIYPIIYRNNSQSFITDKIHQNFTSNLNNNIKEINDLLSSDSNNNKKHILRNRYKNINIFEGSEMEKLKEKLKINNYNALSMDFSNINYNQIDEEIYKKLQDKKKYFLDESERIDNNIKEIKKVFFNKNNKITNNLKSNIIKLNDIKIVNMKIEDEINKLRNLLKEIESNNSIKNEETKK